VIVIPMAGQSSRFLKEGYKKPKYQLEINNKPLFDYCIESFRSFFKTEIFLFIIKYESEKKFVEDRCELLGIEHFKVTVLDGETRGQAETVYLGLKALGEDNERLIIFNIDTIRPNFVLPKMTGEVAGYLEVFKGEGAGWSFVEPVLDTNKVKRTTEKVRISDLCSTGLYYFKSKAMFQTLFKLVSLKQADELQGGEYYIAPMYNHLIEDGQSIHFTEIPVESVIFSGVPKEYEDLLADSSRLLGV
jgi:NDP-sugar pyrophosphorylase family protein